MKQNLTDRMSPLSQANVFIEKFLKELYNTSLGSIFFTLILLCIF